ncbi:hypothetical protein O1L60_12190 [Streptomyces diastatochromogenes]|nr:hypothetical protein [Streptomyces diastatochromogenes]
MLTAKLEKSAAVSSTSARQVAAAAPPGCPSKSAMAVTVRTSSYEAGRWLAMSSALLPAAATRVTPLFFTTLQIAWCQGSWLVLPQLPSSAPSPPRLMFATLMPYRAALFASQLSPQMMLEVLPLPLAPSTFTAYSRAPGATPTTSSALSRAATVPATWVPWPLLSR